jgi:hypothetical protein
MLVVNGARRWDEIVADLLVEVSLFLCSYAPLFAILAIRFHAAWLEVLCGGLAVVGFAAGVAVVARFRGLVGQEWRATRIEDRGYEVAGYLASYLLPFVTVTEPGVRDLVGYAIFLVIAGVVYIRSGMLQINPTLYLLGWRVMQVTVGERWVGYALGRRTLRPGEPLNVRRVTDRVFIASRAEERDAA